MGLMKSRACKQGAFFCKWWGWWDSNPRRMLLHDAFKVRCQAARLHPDCKNGSPTPNRTVNVSLEGISYVHLTIGPLKIIILLIHW